MSVLNEIIRWEENTPKVCTKWDSPVGREHPQSLPQMRFSDGKRTPQKSALNQNENLRLEQNNQKVCPEWDSPTGREPPESLTWLRMRFSDGKRTLPKVYPDSGWNSSMGTEHPKSLFQMWLADGKRTPQKSVLSEILRWEENTLEVCPEWNYITYDGKR